MFVYRPLYSEDNERRIALLFVNNNNNNNNNNNWDNLYSAVHMGITKNKGTVTYKLIVIRLSKQKGLEVCFKAVYCR